MKKIFLLILMAVALNAQTLVVGNVVCKRSQWLTDLYMFGQKGDRDSQINYIRMRRCTIITQPWQVKVVSEEPDRVQFFYRGHHYWAPHGAVR